MNILMTGATGFIGRPLSRRLLDEGHTLYAWVRDAKKAKRLLPPQVQVSEQLDDFSATSFEGVINLAGAPIADRRWSSSRKALLGSSRIDLTHRLADFLHKQASPPAVVLSGSAIGYYGSQPATMALDEMSDFRDGFTHQLCADWEKAADQLAGPDTRVCLLRTGVVLGHNGGALGKMLLPFRLGLGGTVGDGRQAMSWIHRQDWIDAALFLLDHGEIDGPVNLVAPNPVNNREFSQALARALDRPAFFRVPCRGLKIALGEASELLCEGQRVIPKKLLDAGYGFKFDTIDQAFSDIV